VSVKSLDTKKFAHIYILVVAGEGFYTTWRILYNVDII